MGGCSRRGAARGGGAVRGECGENVESFCLRGRSAYVGFSCLFLLAPVRGGTSFLFKREKKRSKETRFKPPIFKCRRRSLQVFGPNVARPPNTIAQSNPSPQLHRRAHASPRRPYRSNCPWPRNTKEDPPTRQSQVASQVRNLKRKT